MTIPVEKNKCYEIEIVDIGTSGEGIGKVDDFTVFIPDAVTGDIVSAKILKVKKNFAFGKCMEIVTPSPKRTTPTCSVAQKCGGCQLQHMNYAEQLAWKTKKVADVLARIGGLKDVTVAPTIGMEDPTYYRNKSQYPIRMVNGEVQIGFFASRSHRIVPSDNCTIQDRRNEDILRVVKDFLTTYDLSIYDEERHEGLVRHLVTKTGYFSREVMVALVINGRELPYSEVLVEQLKAAIPDLTSVVLNHHYQASNVILGAENTVLYGREYIVDTIGDLQFKISPLAFFQVNPIQTKVLYDTALDYADLKGEEMVWDAYCGIGTISLFLAQKAKHVYGVEIVPEAIENAKENALLNGVTNATFFTGEAETIIPQCYAEGIVADTMVVDPPRKGCDQKLLDTITQMAPKKVVYVSCDPATLARDLAYLCQHGYKVERVQPVDMFPHTVHCEVVVKLVK